MKIECRDLSLYYGDVPAIRDVSFALDGQGIYGLLGRNGSGKSTLLSVLAGFRKPSSGEVLIDGEPVFENASISRQVCLIREGADTLDGGEKLEAALKFAGSMRPWWDEDYAGRLLERFQLSPQRKIGQLSRGQRAGLACTLGLASRAPLTMFDEAHLGLDAPSRYIFYEELLRDFMEHPRAIVLSTHLIEEVSSLFEDIVILAAGELLLHSAADDLRVQGAMLTGPAAVVDRLAEGLTILRQECLGPTKAVAVYGNVGHLPPAEGASGVHVAPLPLQDLFVYLTSSEGDR